MERYGLRSGVRYEITAGIHAGREGVLFEAVKSSFEHYNIQIVADNLDTMWTRPGDLMPAARSRTHVSESLARGLGPGPGRDHFDG